MVEEYAEQDTSVKGGNWSNRLAGMSDYLGNRNEMEEWTSFSIGSTKPNSHCDLGSVSGSWCPAQSEGL
jgi:hypothetical protein